MEHGDQIVFSSFAFHQTPPRVQFVRDITNALFTIDATDRYLQDVKLRHKFQTFVEKMKFILDKNPNMVHGEHILSKPASWWAKRCRRFVTEDRVKIWTELNEIVERYLHYFPVRNHAYESDWLCYCEWALTFLTLVGRWFIAQEMFIKRTYRLKVVAPVTTPSKGESGLASEVKTQRFTVDRAKEAIALGVDENGKGPISIERVINGSTVTEKLDCPPYRQDAGAGYSADAARARRARVAVEVGNYVTFRGFQVDVTHQTTLEHLHFDRLSDPAGVDMYFMLGRG